MWAIGRGNRWAIGYSELSTTSVDNVRRSCCFTGITLFFRRLGYLFGSDAYFLAVDNPVDNLLSGCEAFS